MIESSIWAHDPLPDAFIAAEKEIGDFTYPHCDPRIIHSRGVCNFCDKEPLLQGIRQGLSLKFTDQLEAGEPLLPWEDRSRESAEEYLGNTPGNL